VWFLNKFLRFLELCGRKKTLVDFAGNEIVHRWYLFYYEEDQDDRWIAKLPNVYIHHNLVKHPDGPDCHTHPWNTISWIANGGYWEEFINGTKRRLNRFTFAYRSRNDFHRIIEADPNTWTIFAHGFRRRQWSFKSETCKTVCQTCNDKYDGVCYNAKNEAPYEAYFSDKGGAWKATVWLRTTLPGLKEKIARRKKALERIKFKPKTIDEIKSQIVCQKVSNSSYGAEIVKNHDKTA
jgi:hypothetical protein